MKKIGLLVLIMSMLLAMTSCKKKQIVIDYPSLQKTTNITNYVDIDEVFDIFDKKDDAKYIIVFGFKACPWCQACISYVNDIAKAKKYKKVSYLDIKKINDLLSPEYDKYVELFNMIKGSIGEPNKIMAPTVIVVKNGIVLGYHVGTVEGHEKVDGVLPPMTSDQIDELKSIYNNLF